MYTIKYEIKCLGSADSNIILGSVRWLETEVLFLVVSLSNRVTMLISSSHFKWINILSFLIPFFLKYMRIYAYKMFGLFKQINTARKTHWIFSGLHFLAFGLNTEIYAVNLSIKSKYRKIRIWKTPSLDTFHTVKEVQTAKEANEIIWSSPSSFVKHYMLIGRSSNTIMILYQT